MQEFTPLSSAAATPKKPEEDASYAPDFTPLSSTAASPARGDERTPPSTPAKPEFFTPMESLADESYAADDFATPMESLADSPAKGDGSFAGEFSMASTLASPREPEPEPGD